MRSFLRSTLTRTSIVALALAGCATTVGCGDDTSGTAPEEDTGMVEETGQETSVPPDSAEPDTTPEDTGSTEDSTVDSTVSETSADAADTAVSETTAEAGDDTSVADSGAADSATTDAASDAVTTDATPDADAAPACTEGTLCSDKTVCKSGACTACGTDTECSSASAGTLCIAGKCEIAECKPPSATGCTTTGSICCATSTSAGKCIAPVTGKTMCCSDTDCAGAPGGLTKCDTATNTCTCPDPTPGTWYVGTTGNDTSGNGSAACPFKTITKAISKTTGASTASTIILQKATTGVATYGTGCTGGGTCDTTPIAVPSTVTAGLVIKGAGAAADVVVTGNGNSVFTVAAPGVGFESMTITPTKTGTANAGGHGIVYDYATAGTESTIKNVVVSGTLATSVTAGTGTAIYLKGAAAPTIGTGVSLTGGFHGVRAEGTSAGKITGGPTTAQTIISNFGGACVYVTSTSTTAAPALTASSTSTTSDILVRDCGTSGAIVIDTAFGGPGSSFSGVQILRSTSGPTYPGLHLLSSGIASISSSTITGLLGTGIWAEGSSKLTSTAGLVVTSNVGGGIIVGGATAASPSGAATADLAGASVRSNTGDGLLCSVVGGSVKLRNSTFLSNTGSGLRLAGNCSANLGSSSEFGGNTFNTVTQPNLESGICSNAGGTIVAPSKWKCAVGTAPTTGCSSGLPENVTPSGMFRCNTGKDVTVGGGTTWDPAGMHQCCNSVP